ncbi:MAG: hypothetical protein LBH76_09530, partial [Propionibacteriaceae bacterium]|nr:hypothetical protein [Propionibacteriaceae bacterium]
GVALTGPEHWTQGEALWKAAGWGRGTPRPGQIPLPACWRDGWQTSRDGAWWLYTDGAGPRPWSLVLPTSGPVPPHLRLAGSPPAASSRADGPSTPTTHPPVRPAMAQ